MKKTYTLLAVLLTVCTALPAAAQKNITNKVTRVVVSAEKAHKRAKIVKKYEEKLKNAFPICHFFFTILLLYDTLAVVVVQAAGMFCLC